MPEAQTQWFDQLAAIADLMLGVAHIDGDFDAEEARTIRSQLAMFGRINGLSEVVEARIETFDPAAFDLAETAASIRFNGRSDRQLLLELVRDVLDADDIRDQRETRYFLAVAEALGVPDLATSLLASEESSKAEVPFDDYD